jgi:hypothetical protein
MKPEQDSGLFVEPNVTNWMRRRAIICGRPPEFLQGIGRGVAVLLFANAALAQESGQAGRRREAGSVRRIRRMAAYRRRLDV